MNKSYIRRTILSVALGSLLVYQPLLGQQSVTIGSEQLKDNAILWLNGNGNQGLLLPTVSSTNAISNPDEGLIVYQTTDNRIYYFNGSAWTEVGGGGTGSGNTYSIQYDQGTNQLTLIENGTPGTAINLSNDALSLNGQDLPGGTPSPDQILVYNGTAWEYRDLPSGTFSGVTTTATLTGDGNTTPLGVNAGTGPNQIVQLDASGNLPALDGSALIGLNDSSIDGQAVDMSTAPTTGQVLKFDGGAWVPDADLQGGTGSLPVLGNAQLVTSDGTNNLAVSVGGDLAMNNSGEFAIQDDAVQLDDIEDNDNNRAILANSGTGDIQWVTPTGDNQVLGSNGAGNLVFRDATTAISNGGNGIRTSGANDAFIATELSVREALDAIGGSPAWNLGGNAGTTPGTSNDFIGTTDAQDFVIGTNGTERIRIASDASNNADNLINIPEVPGREIRFINSANNADIVADGQMNIEAGFLQLGGTNTSVTGLLGINETNPEVSLDINGTDAIRLPIGSNSERPASAEAGMLRFNDETSSYEGHDGTTWNTLGGAGASSLQAAYDAGESIVMTSASGDISITTTTTPRTSLFIQESTGRVGIGTTFPGSGLTVAGTDLLTAAVGIFNTTGGNDWRLNVDNSGVFNITQANGPTYTPFTINSRTVTMGDIGADLSDAVLTVDGDNGDFQFLNGNVGIGTTSPENQLHIVNSTATPNLKLEGPLNGNDIDPVLRFTETFTTDFGFDLYLDSDQNTLKFRSIDTDAVQVDNILTMTRTDGNVGVGTSTPARQFEIFSSSSTFLRISGTGGAFASGGLELNGTGTLDWRIQPGVGILTFAQGDVDGSMTNQFFMNNTFFSPATNGNKTLGSSSNRWSTVFATNGTISTSDYRLKKNIQSFHYGLQELLLLNPVSFKWKSDKVDMKTHLGFIAQEVQQIIPEVIDMADDQQKTLGLSYTELLPVAVKAIQEQQELINKQQQEIDQLQAALIKTEENNSSVQSELEVLKAQIDKLSSIIQAEAKQGDK